MKTYTCKFCGQIFEKPGQIGHHVGMAHGKNAEYVGRKKAEAVARYAANPRHCRQCGQELDRLRARSKAQFCNHSCAAIFNNAKREKKEKIKKSLLKYDGSNGSKERSDVYWKGAFDRWLKGENPSEFSLQGLVTRGDLSVPAKRRIKDIFLREQNHKCAICGQEDLWNGKPFIMILDHIDGNSTNHLKSNLRLICPICDSQLAGQETMGKEDTQNECLIIEKREN
jgi:hypothetical protein